MKIFNKDEKGRFVSKKIGRIDRFLRLSFLAFIGFGITWTAAVSLGYKLPTTKVVYNSATSTIVVTNEKEEWEAKWLSSDKAKNMAEHEYLLAKKTEIEKELNDNRSLSLK